MLRRPADRLAIQLAVLLGLTFLVGIRATDGLDDAVLGWILPWRTPLIDQVFQAVTLVGDPIVTALIAAGLTVVLVARDGRHGQVALLFLAGIALEFALKQLVFQPGPPNELVRDAVLIPGLRELSLFTYPSGHAMRVTFLAVLVGARFERLRLPAAVIVLLVAAGRVYLATGWIADIAGGLLAGLALATVAEVVTERLRSTRPAAAVAVP
jgi:membrane-associated phospholipid phosphatase